MIMSLKNKTCFSGKSPSSSLPMRHSLGGGGRDGIVAHIAALNDAAIYKWAVDNDRQEASALLTQALHRVNALSKTLLSLQQQRRRKRSIAQATTTTSTKKSAMKHKIGISALDTAAQDPFIVPLPVDIDTKCVNVCFNKAFLLKASVTSGGGRNTTADQMESVFIAAAVVLYNVALFFQHQHNGIAEPSQSPYHLQQRQRIQQDQSAAAAALASEFNESYVEKYYRVADKVLSEYMKVTHRPLWTLQAAIWYNLADSTRFQQAVTPASCRYFGQLETIMELLPDPDDLLFFKHHIAVARMQMAHCYCAVVA
jgi:hypothetical protein